MLISPGVCVGVSEVSGKLKNEEILQFPIFDLNCSSSTSTLIEPVLDLDADDSGGTTGYDYHVDAIASFLTVIGICDIDVSITPVSVLISEAGITLSNPQNGDELFIDGTLPNGISATISPIQIILNGEGSVSDYEECFRMIKFRNTSEIILVDRSILSYVKNQSIMSNIAETIIEFSVIVPTALDINIEYPVDALVDVGINMTTDTVTSTDIAWGFPYASNHE